MPRSLRLLLVVLVATLAGCGDVVGDIFPGGGGVFRPIWSPNGEQIVFDLQGEEGPGGIYIVDADGGGLQRLRDLETDSPDWQMARRVLKGARDDRRAGYARLRRIGVKVGPRGYEYPVFDVAWSPDRQRIAYSFRRAGRTDQDVYVVRADGSSRPRLLAGHADNPSWSPDGRLVAVERGLDGIFVVPPSGGRLRRLPIEPRTEPGLYDLAWSPDGTEIAFVTSDALYVAEVESGDVRRLADTGDA